MKKNSKYMMDIVPGVVIAVFSLLYLSQVPGIQAFEGLGSTPLDNHFVPCLGAAIAEKREVIASFVALVIYVGLMDLVGFVIMTVLYTFAQILILTPREKWKKNFVPAGIVALVAGFLLYYLFKVQLNVLLPAGILPLFGV